MDRCFERCQGRFHFTNGLPTKDGRPTWNVVCEGGKQGGCKGPNSRQLEELSMSAGRLHGASTQTEPLAVSKTLGPLTRTWAVPGVIGRQGLRLSDVTFRRK